MLCLITGDINIDHFEWFLHITVFPPVISKYVGWNTLKLCQYPVSRYSLSSNSHLLILASTDDSYYSAAGQMVLFYFYHSFYIY